MKKHLITAFTFASLTFAQYANGQIWSIGKNDNLTTEFALGPDKYKDFLAHDFGYEDRYFLIGYSNEKTDFPYVIPGPSDGWGGTGGTSG